MIYACERCRTKLVGLSGQVPAGWIWTERLRVCGDCHRTSIKRPA